MKHHLAIDVGSCYVKVIEGCERNGRLVINKIGYFPNPFPDLRNSLVEREQDVFVKTLKEFLQKHGIREKRTVSNVSGTGVIAHYFEIPKLSENEIKSAVQLEMMQVTPGGTKNLEYDYIFFPGKNGRKTVLFIGYQKERCEFFTRSLQRAGLKPLIMDHDSLAVLNCFNFLNKKHSEVVFLLNVGHKITNFVLAEKNGFILIRDIPSGGKDLAESIANKRNISVEDAEIYSNRKENTDELIKIVATDLEDLLSEVTKGMEYFKNRTGKSPETLFLTGGVSIMPGITELFEQHVKIKTVLWNPLEHMVNVKTLLLPEDLKKRGSMFTVSLGLVLRKIK